MLLFLAFTKLMSESYDEMNGVDDCWSSKFCSSAFCGKVGDEMEDGGCCSMTTSEVEEEVGDDVEEGKKYERRELLLLVVLSSSAVVAIVN